METALRVETHFTAGPRPLLTTPADSQRRNEKIRMSAHDFLRQEKSSPGSLAGAGPLRYIASLYASLINALKSELEAFMSELEAYGPVR